MLKKLSKSFFDDSQSQDSFWEKKQLAINEKLVEQQCLLFQKSSKTGFWISRNYCIYDQKLIKLKANCAQICYVNLNLSRIELIKYKNSSEKEAANKKKYGFRVVRNMHYKELYSRNKELNKVLWEVLKKYAILITFKDDFTLQKSIGKGNFAKVFLAVKKENKKQYAVKCFEKLKLTNGDTDRKALLKEIEIIRKISHKGIIKVHEVYEDEIQIYIVQDYLEGGELYQQIKKSQQLSEKQVAGIISNLLNSINYLHQKNILHRDLKPENMILRKKGAIDDIVIADFGLADIYDPFGNYMFQRCGTPGFVAPEVLQDRIYDNKVDIFSIGCLMFLLLSGKSPFKGSTYDEVVMRNYHCKVDYPSVENKVTQNCFSLLKQMLHYKPSNRPNCIQALRHPWFQQNLDEKKYEEIIKESQEEGKEQKSNSTVHDQGSPQFMKQFVKPVGKDDVNHKFCTPQIGNKDTNKKDEKQLFTPQLNKVMEQIQEQLDVENIKCVDFDDFTDLQFDDESPQSHKMPQYQLIGKLKQGIDSATSSYYASPLYQITPSMKPLQQLKQIDETNTVEDDVGQESSIRSQRYITKVMMNLKAFAQQQ